MGFCGFVLLSNRFENIRICESVLKQPASNKVIRGGAIGVRVLSQNNTLKQQEQHPGLFVLPNARQGHIRLPDCERLRNYLSRVFHESTTDGFMMISKYRGSVVVSHMQMVLLTSSFA